MKTRILTGISGAFFLIYILSFSPIAWYHTLFSIVVTVAIFLGGTEYAAIRWNIMDAPTQEKHDYPVPQLKHVLIGFAYAVPVLMTATFQMAQWDFAETYMASFVAWACFCVFIATALIYRNATDMHTASNKLLNVIAGFVYLSLPGSCLLKLVELAPADVHRAAPIYFCLATLFLGDTGAYFVGVRFGKHKLFPKVSPKKSLEGSLGGLAASALTAWACNHIFGLHFQDWAVILAGICIGFGGQIGDLIESAFKRAGGYKDSGRLLPGHGGMLDRIDSLILGVPMTYVFFYFF
jgi:phosphatidate cytidylyltransferase